MSADPSPARSAEDLDADFRDYVLRDYGLTTLGVVGGLMELHLEPERVPCRGRPRDRRVLLPRWLGPFDGLRRGAWVRLYGGAGGWPVRGVDVAGTEVFYRPLEETAEGWWRDVTSRPGHQDEVLHRYSPARWRTLLPGAPTEFALTRTTLAVNVRGRAAEDVFPLYSHLSTYAAAALPGLWLAVCVHVVLVAVLVLLWPETFAACAALLCGWLLGRFFSRSRALHLRGSGQPRSRRYPLLGRDPGMAELVRAINLYHGASEKRYWHEQLGHPLD